MKSRRPPVVSIIIPNFNYAHFLEEALESVIEQTFPDWEAIVVDNFSSDNSVQVVQHFTDDRIRVLSFANNGSIAASRNHGVQNAVGELIAFLDSDDTWHPNKLSEALEQISRGADLVYHHLDVIGTRPFFGAKKVKGRRLGANTLVDLVTKGNGIATSSVVVSKQKLRIVNLMDESLEVSGVEDYDTWLKLAKEGAGFALIPKVLGSYRVHSASASRRRMAHKVRLVVKRYLPELGQRSRRKALATLSYIEGRELFLEGQTSREVCKRMLQALSGGPLPLRIRALFMLGAIGIRRAK